MTKDESSISRLASHANGSRRRPSLLRRVSTSTGGDGETLSSYYLCGSDAQVNARALGQKDQRHVNSVVNIYNVDVPPEADFIQNQSATDPRQSVNENTDPKVQHNYTDISSRLLNLTFSLWLPEANRRRPQAFGVVDEVPDNHTWKDRNDIYTSHRLEKAVLFALVDFLCEYGTIRMIFSLDQNGIYSDNDPSSENHNLSCGVDYDPDSTNGSSASVLDWSILRSVPIVNKTIQSTSSGGTDEGGNSSEDQSSLNFSTWTIAYKVVSIGMTYLEQAIAIDPSKGFGQLSSTALKLLQQAVQMNLNERIMIGEIDILLRKILNNDTREEYINVLTSPVGLENKIFTREDLARTKKPGKTPPAVAGVHSRETWGSPLQVTGVVMLVISLSGFSALSYAALMRSRHPRIRIAGLHPSVLSMDLNDQYAADLSERCEDGSCFKDTAPIPNQDTDHDRLSVTIESESQCGERRCAKRFPATAAELLVHEEVIVNLKQVKYAATRSTRSI